MDYGDWRLGAPQIDPEVQAVVKALRAPNVSPPEQNGYWVKTWPGAETVDVQVVDKLGANYGPGVKGWTVCDKNKRSCQIMILRNADRACIEEHERRHAAGYDHPDYPKAFICPE